MQKQTQTVHTHHIPVLLDAVLATMQPQPGERYLDLTAGYGGHARAILEQTETAKAAVLVDRDTNAIAELQHLFAERGAEILHKDFYSASQQLLAEGRQFDIVLADLGVSSPHLNVASRGFAIQAEGPLDMRMDQTQALSAAELINTWSEAELRDILIRYGEEPRAGKIAQFIVAHRPVQTTTELAHIVARAYPGHSKVHPATRTFQALRIAVNDELGLLTKSLPLWLQLLAPGGRLGIISFHSLEDRLVKQFLAERGGDRYDADVQILTKRPLTASQNELVFNPRSRSAKLRAAVKK